MIAATALRSADPATAPRSAPARFVRAVSSPGYEASRATGGDVAELESLAPIGACRKRIRRGENLYNAGDAFRSLYIVRVGVLKSFRVTDDGTSQVTAFSMMRDVVGLDGIQTGRHQSSAVALEDSEVLLIPFAECEKHTTDSPASQQLMLRILGREIARGHDVMLMLGTMNAEQKLAAFLLDLSERYGRLGYSRTEFVLRMTREDIGSYIGLKLETVSRLLSRFQQEGLIQVHGKCITLVDVGTLRQRAKGGPARRAAAERDEEAAGERMVA